MVEALKEALHASTAWFEAYGLWGLILLAVAESSFFPVPPDTVLIPLVGSSTAKGIGWALTVAAATTAASVFGSWIGYAIGVWGGRPVLNRFVKDSKKIERVEKFFEERGAWAIAVAGFTPIPYKVFAICGGVFRVDLVGFTLGGIVGRGLRFFMVALAVYFFGDEIVDNLDIIFKVSLGLVAIWVVYLVIRARMKRKEAPEEDASSEE